MNGPMRNQDLETSEYSILESLIQRYLVPR